MTIQSKEAQVAAIIECMDQSRLDAVGGYPSQWVIDHGRVIHADYQASKEYAAVELTITPVDQFLAENSCWLEEGQE